MTLPQSEMALLQPSTSIGTSKKSRKQVLREAIQQKQLGTGGIVEKSDRSVDAVQEGDNESSLSGTSWRRKNRKRRKLKVEKVMFDPKPPVGAVSSGEDGSDGEEEGDVAEEGT